MSRLSRDQRQHQVRIPSRQFVYRSNGDRWTGRTIETPHKWVSLPAIPTRESSPLGAAASSRSESRKAETGHQANKGNANSQSNMLSEVRVVFPKRRQLYSVDGFGRRSEIETGHMSEGAYQALLEACQNPIRFDGPPQDYDLTAANETPFEIPEGCKLGPETRLPLPEWWELPGAVATVGEIQAMIRRNLKRAEREGKGALSRVLAASLARIS